MKYRAPETTDTGGGNWLTLPGTYHGVITHADEHPVNAKGESLDGFRITVQALEGTPRDESGKFAERDRTVDLMFWHPKLTDKNEGMFARQKQAKFFLATGLMSEQQLGNEIDIDLEDAIGRQVIFTLEEQEGKTGRSFLQLHFADIWHVDDPDTSSYPKCQKSISLIAKPLRRAQKPKPQTKPAAKDKDLDDI